jgi:hypothetical protein
VSKRSNGPCNSERQDPHSRNDIDRIRRWIFSGDWHLGRHSWQSRGFAYRIFPQTFVVAKDLASAFVNDGSVLRWDVVGYVSIPSALLLDGSRNSETHTRIYGTSPSLQRNRFQRCLASARYGGHASPPTLERLVSSYC